MKMRRRGCTTTGGMGEECEKYHGRLAELRAIKKGERYSKTISWIRAKISFSIIRSGLLCLGGTRTFRNRKCNVKEVDLDIETEVARIYYSPFVLIQMDLFLGDFINFNDKFKFRN